MYAVKVLLVSKWKRQGETQIRQTEYPFLDFHARAISQTSFVFSFLSLQWLLELLEAEANSIGHTKGVGWGPTSLSSFFVGLSTILLCSPVISLLAECHLQCLLVWCCGASDFFSTYVGGPKVEEENEGKRDPFSHLSVCRHVFAIFFSLSRPFREDGTTLPFCLLGPPRFFRLWLWAKERQNTCYWAAQAATLIPCWQPYVVLGKDGQLSHSPNIIHTQDIWERRKEVLPFYHDKIAPNGDTQTLERPHATQERSWDIGPCGYCGHVLFTPLFHGKVRA